MVEAEVRGTRERATRLKFTPDPSGFYPAVKRRVEEYLEREGLARYGGRVIAVKGVGYAAAAAGFYAALVGSGVERAGAWGQAAALALAVGFGMASLLLAINIGHDAAHGTLCRSRRVNHVIQFACFCLLGASSYLWRLRHIKSHHVFPNVNGCDIDIDENPLLRLSPRHPRRWFQRWQHIYGPAAYVLVFLHTIFVQDWVYLRKRELANMTGIRHPAGAYATFVLTKAVYFGLVLVVPLLTLELSWWRVLIGYLVMTAVCSVTFVLLLIGTHFSMETEFPEIGEDGRLGHDWATHALLTSLDWNPQSRFWNAVVGGANAHAAHHLFPTVCHVHYPAITAIIKTAAAEFGVRYNEQTLLGMVRSHLRFLRRMGEAGAGAGR